MKKFKEGDEITLEDVRESFQLANNKELLKESFDFSKIPVDKDGVLLFNSIEEYERSFGGTVSFEEAFRW